MRATTQASLWKVCIRNFTVVAGFPLCQFTFQYTSCILCETRGILGGTWKVRDFTVVIRFLLVQVTCRYTVCILEESAGILNVVWKGCVLISYILQIMSPGFKLEWNLFAGLLVSGSIGIKHHFYWFPSLLLFQQRQIKTWSISILNSRQRKLSRASLALTILMKTNYGMILKKITTFFNLRDMFRCYEQLQLQIIWKTVRTNN